MAPRQHRKSKLDPYLEKVGVIPDAEVAAVASVTAENVRVFRKSRGIPASWRGEAEPMVDGQAAPEDAVAATVDPEPKKATKKRKAPKPKEKKPAAKPRKARAKKPEAEPAPEVEQVEVAVPEVEPEADASPVSAEVPSLDPEQPVEAEAGVAPAPVPPHAPKQKRKPAKPKAKKAAARTPRAKKPTAEPVVEAESVVEEAPIIEPVVVAEPTPDPIVEAEPGDDLPPELESAPASTPAPKVSSIRKPRRTKLGAYLDKVGQIPDKQVAELAGVTPEHVRTYRARRGIPARWRVEDAPAPVESVPFPKATTKPVKGKAGAAGVSRARRGKLTPYLDQIGIVPDARIAELSGTTSANVRAFRLRHDIPARWRGEGEPLPNEEAAVVPTVAEEQTSPAGLAEVLPPEVAGAAVPLVPVPTTLLEAYVVTVEGPVGAVEYAVVGKDIVEATTAAVAGMARAGIMGKLVATRFLARVLEG